MNDIMNVQMVLIVGIAVASIVITVVTINTLLSAGINKIIKVVSSLKK